MYSFKNDYSEGAHSRILNALVKVNREQDEGYGEDRYSLAAADRLKKLLKNPDAAVHFLAGGTQVNLVAISAFLRPYQAAICAATGHINVHETGAIEATGHKVLAVTGTDDGKLTPERIQKVLEAHADEHMVQPKLVYISDTTEIGGVYSKKELINLSNFCWENGLLLYLDGARLGSALTSTDNDLLLSDLPKLVDAFYIGGTKNGALIGEALVICNMALQEDFRYMIKQKGAMLAKGRLIGIQFLELFRDDLFYQLADHANRMAIKMAEAIRTTGFDFMTDPSSNQIFPIFPNDVITELETKYAFIVWKKVDASHSVIRLVTSWATEEEKVEAWIADLQEIARTTSTRKLS